jgi:hypothetical protein
MDLKVNKAIKVYQSQKFNQKNGSENFSLNHSIIDKISPNNKTLNNILTLI